MSKEIIELLEKALTKEKANLPNTWEIKQALTKLKTEQPPAEFSSILREYADAETDKGLIPAPLLKEIASHIDLLEAKAPEQPPAKEYMHQWLKKDAVCYDMPNEEIIKYLANENEEILIRLDRAEASKADLLKGLEQALKDMENEAVQCSGEWEKGLFCGLEDRNIIDRYDACMFGYEAALKKVQEWVLCGFEAAIAKAKKEG